MTNLQFRTNLIEWGKAKDGTVRPLNAFVLKEVNAYGSEQAQFLATSLIPDMISYVDIDYFDHVLEEYDDMVEDNDVDPVADLAPNGLSEEEAEAARILYMKFKDVEWPDDERQITTDSLLKAYFESPDVSKKDKDELESIWIEPLER